MTFDDGYASTVRIVDLLRAYSVPAVVYVSTGYVESGKRYWWDTVWDERLRRGTSASEIAREIGFLESQLPAAVDRYLAREFGPSAARPKVTSTARSPRGSSRISRRRSTSRSATTRPSMWCSPAWTPSWRARELEDAQLYLERALGTPPTSVSYPEGAYDAATLGLARDLGFASGFTTVRRGSDTPPGRRLHELGRFQLRGARSEEADRSGSQRASPRGRRARSSSPPHGLNEGRASRG